MQLDPGTLTTRPQVQPGEALTQASDGVDVPVTTVEGDAPLEHDRTGRHRSTPVLRAGGSQVQ